MSDASYKIDDLERITGLTRRTIRFYIQQGLLARPIGERRGAHYGATHLEALLRIRRLASEGFTLEAIRRLMLDDGRTRALPTALPKPGTSRTCVHMTIAPGVELTVDPMAAELTHEQIRALLQRIAAVVSENETEKEDA